MQNSILFHLDDCFDNVLGSAMSHVTAQKFTGPWKELVSETVSNDIYNKYIS